MNVSELCGGGGRVNHNDVEILCALRQKVTLRQHKGAWLGEQEEEPELKEMKRDSHSSQ